MRCLRLGTTQQVGWLLGSPLRRCSGCQGESGSVWWELSEWLHPPHPRAWLRAELGLRRGSCALGVRQQEAASSRGQKWAG